MIATLAGAGVLAGCGSGARQDANEPFGTFPVKITSASFPASQRLSEHTHLVITVQNTGSKSIPDLAVTITDPRYGTSIKAFSYYLDMQGLASHSRPVWVVDRPPGPCLYSCQGGGGGSYVTAYANTWALGKPLPPGQTATFDWGVTAVQTGTYPVHYEIAGGLNGKAKARLAGGGIPAGTFNVKISGKPATSYVNNSGQVVTTG